MPRRFNALRYCRLALLFSCGAIPFFAAPEIASVWPNAVLPGKRTVLTFKGSDLGSASNLWTSFGATARWLSNSTSGEVRFEVQCPDTSPAVYAVQLFGSNGVSEYHLILADAIAAQSAAADRHSVTNAQPLEIPGAIDAATKPERVDYYRIQTRAGDPLSIECIAQRLGSEMDPVVEVLDEHGREWKRCDDEPGVWRDARFRFMPPESGHYILAVHDVGFGGGPSYFYRLRVSHDPLVWYTFPLVDPTESGTRFEQFGTEPKPVQPGSPANPPEPGLLPSTPVLAEREPNDSIAEAQPITAPATINGRIGTGNDHDLFLFHAERGDKLVFQSESRSLGSPCDLLLTLKKADGKVITQNDSSVPTEAALTNSFSEAGDYCLEVQELTGTAPAGAPYRIKVAPFQPGVAASTETDRLQLGPGENAKIKVSLSRFDYTGPVTIALETPVTGLELSNTVINKKEGEITVTLDRAARPGTILHARLVAKAGTNAPPRRVTTEPALRKSFPMLAILPAELDGVVSIGVTAR